MHSDSFTPALGNSVPVRYYDLAVALLTREETWRTRLIESLAPKAGETILDLGCGTGTLAIRIQRREPAARLIAVDPDENVLAIARTKARAVGATITFQRALGDDLPPVQRVDAATCSLVLHQCPVPMKRAILGNLHAVLKPGGRVVVGDYGLQRSVLMRLGFRLVQWADGHEDTQSNADGILPALMSDAGFIDVRETEVIPTPTGSISIYTARRVG